MSDSEVEVPECCKGYAAIPDEAVRLQCVSSAIAAFRDAVEKCEAAGVGQSAPVVELRRKFTETQRYLRRLRGEPEEGDTSDEKNVGSREEGAQQEEYVMPESCKPFLSIADVTLRLKVLRQAVSGTKQAMEQAKLADTSESSQLALAERASEMEGYVQHLEEGNHNVQNSSSSSSSSSNNNNGGLAAARGDAETLEDVTGPNSEGAGQTMLDDQLLTENILEDEELLASLPTVELDFDDDGTPVPPTVCEAYHDMLQRTQNPAAVVASMIPAVNSWKTILRDMRQKGYHDPNSQCHETYAHTAQRTAEVIAYMQNIASADDISDTADAMHRHLSHIQKIQREQDAVPGATEKERMARVTRRYVEEVRVLDPFAQALSTRFRQLAEMCCWYGPPEYDTSIFAPVQSTSLDDKNDRDIASTEVESMVPKLPPPAGAVSDGSLSMRSDDAAASIGDNLQRKPFFRHFIDNYVDGVAGFASDLQGGTAQYAVSKQDCRIFRALVQELCDPANHTGRNHWNSVRSATFLVAAAMASAPPSAWASSMPTEQARHLDFVAHDADNFNAMRAIVRSAMDTITGQLSDMESSMRASGEFERLAALRVEDERAERISECYADRNEVVGTVGDIPPPLPAASTGPLRQDNIDMLGRHPEYLRFKSAFCRMPCRYPGHPPEMERRCMLYLWTDPPELIVEALDDDMNMMIKGMLVQQAEVEKNYRMNPLFLKQIDEYQISERCVVQPYVLWLMKVARQIAPAFHGTLRGLFGDRYSAGPIKGFLRCAEKVREKYSHLDKPMPSAAHLLDVVRGIVSCASVAEMEESFHKVCEHMEVLRAKNSFADTHVEFGFRQILINVRFSPNNESIMPAGCAMVCEVQLNLDSYVDVKHKIHRFYSVLRLQDRHGLYQLLRKAAHPF